MRGEVPIAAVGSRARSLAFQRADSDETLGCLIVPESMTEEEWAAWIYYERRKRLST